MNPLLPPTYYSFVRNETAAALSIQAVARSGHDQGTALVVNRGDRITTPNWVQVLSGSRGGEHVVFGKTIGYITGTPMQMTNLNPAELMAEGE